MGLVDSLITPFSFKCEVGKIMLKLPPHPLEAASGLAKTGVPHLIGHTRATLLTQPHLEDKKLDTAIGTSSPRMMVPTLQIGT